MKTSYKYLGESIGVSRFEKFSGGIHSDDIKMDIRGKKFFIAGCEFGYAIANKLDDALKDCRKLIYKNKGLKYR